jgi:serine/threonine protein kinase
MDSRGFSAKVADFGLSRVLHTDGEVLGLFGTVSHVPPEQVKRGTVSQAGGATQSRVFGPDILLGTKVYE